MHTSIFFTDQWEDLQYPFSRQNDPDRIQDIQDGNDYRHLMKPGKFLSVPEHTGLVLCADGVKLFKSCGQSLWPLLFAVTSLPPRIRMNADNIILAGVWQGSVKPNLATILKPVLDKVHALHHRGIMVETPVGKRCIKVNLLLGVFDLPAKVMATNFKQYNGNYGCNYCLDIGRHVSYRHIFLPDAPHEPRTTFHLQEATQRAVQEWKSVSGVKGPSALTPHLDILTGVPIDYIHAILEGVADTLLTYWLASKYHSRRFYLGTRVSNIDRNLLCIKPPPEFRRSPRSISTHSYWKASEFRAWLLYYCLPVLHDILPSDYVHHLALLVSAMHILLGDCVTKSSLDTGKSLLQNFYSLLPNLYPEIMCTINFHYLIHLVQFVERWGPLWSDSTFGFENMNGRLRSHCHGTRNVLPQLVRTIRMRQALPGQTSKLAESETSDTIQFLNAMCPKHDKKGDTIESKGRINHQSLEESEKALLVAQGMIDDGTRSHKQSKT